MKVCVCVREAYLVTTEDVTYNPLRTNYQNIYTEVVIIRFLTFTLKNHPRKEREEQEKQRDQNSHKVQPSVLKVAPKVRASKVFYSPYLI
jgi:hypothetical protein